VVRDLADRSGKEIELRIVGQETRLDRAIIERLGDPMVHLIRNAVDHALETPQERLEGKKPRMGRITLMAGHEGDRVAIRVEDDGRGLDREKIVRADSVWDFARRSPRGKSDLRTRFLDA
jgi:two-component system, chemotaxis family, sensor kinase CheA